MFEVKVASFFSAAHSLRGYEGKCESLHGHNWQVEVIVKSKSLNSQGLVLDFKDLKGALKQILDELDHKCLNEVAFFKKRNPSSENIAYFIYKNISGALKKKGLEIAKVNVWEQRDSSASYYEE